MSIERSVIQRSGHRFTLKPLRLQTVTTLGGLALLLAPLPGCQSITGNPSVSNVRVIDASPDAPGLDMYLGGSILAYNLGFGTITSYVPISPGGYAVSADEAGTRTQLVTAGGTFLAGQQYTVLVGNYSALMQELVLKDQNQAAPSGDISLRFVDQSVRTGALDVYLVPAGSTLLQAKPLLTNIPFLTNTGYMNIPSGTYTIAVVPTGTVLTANGTTLYTGAAVAYTGGTAQTIVLIDTVLTTTPAIQVVTANDYEPAD